MSGPFSRTLVSSQPIWSTNQTVAANFSQFPTFGLVQDEVGYGEGGYGEDGYDSPGLDIHSAPVPVWTVETVR